MEVGLMKNLIYSGLLTFCVWSAPATAAEGESGQAPGEPRVARAQFTTAIVDREPVDRVLVVSPPVEEVFFFTDLRHMEGDTAVHSWRYRGQLVSRVSFEVGGPRWRVYSKVLLEPHQFGEWSVTVSDGSGWPFYTELFRYQPAQADDGVSAADVSSSE